MFKAGDPVQPSKTSKTVRVRNGHTESTSGPFVKTGDQLVGFYVIEAKDLDEAVAYAAKCPVARAGAMEVEKAAPPPPRRGEGRGEGRGSTTRRR